MNRTLRIATSTLTGIVGLLAATAATFGVFGRGDGTFVTATSARGEIYEMATTGVYAYSGRQLVAEGVGWDVFTLAVAAPAMLIAAALVARGSYRGTIVAAGLFGYFAYLYLEYAVAWALGPLTPLFIVLLAASVLGLIGTATLLVQVGVDARFGEGYPRRAWAILSIGMATMLGIMWTGRMAEALTAPLPELHGEVTMPVQVLDLGLMLPIAVLLGVLALRRHPVGLLASALFSVVLVSMSAAIFAMMVSASIVDRTLQLPPLILFGIASLAGTYVTVRSLRSVRPVERTDPGPQTRAEGRPASLTAAG